METKNLILVPMGAVHSSRFELFCSREHMKMDECMVEIKDQEAQHLKVTLFARQDINAQEKEAQHYITSRYGLQTTTMMWRGNG